MIKKRTIISGIMTVGILALSHSFWLHKFQFEIFTIILILSYLLSYKLVDYIADFKTVKNKSRIDIMFLTMFFVLLFIPMSHISNATISKSENRTLAMWKSFLNDKKKINYNFGKDFDNFYNDRFFLRAPLVKGYSLFRYYIAVNYYENQKGFVNKRNHWMNTKYNYNYNTNIWKVSENTKEKTIYNVKKLKEFCDKNDMKLYILIVPRKGEICTKELYPYLKNINVNKQTQEIIDYVKEKTGIEIVYPYDELVKLQADDTAYFKTDHHWTDEGAYLGYLKLMTQIQKDFPDIKISQPNDFNYKYSEKVKVDPTNGYFSGITYRNMNLHDKKLFDRKYKYFYHKTFDCMKYEHENYYKRKYHIYTFHNNIDAPNAVLFGDSFTLNLLPIFPTSFEYTTNVYSYTVVNNTSWAFNIKRFENYILRNNPKVFVVTLSEIKRLKYLFKENE